MSEHPQTFLARVLGGEASPNDIDNYIDAWHQNPRGQHLHSSLGMTRAEYASWLTDPESLLDILAQRKVAAAANAG